jgi:hypothetical protein
MGRFHGGVAHNAVHFYPRNMARTAWFAVKMSVVAAWDYSGRDGAERRGSAHITIARFHRPAVPGFDQANSELSGRN